RRARLEMEIEPGAAAVRLPAHLGGAVAVEEPARGVRLVGRLVGREANIAVDPEDRSLRVAYEFRGEVREARVHFAHELRQRLANVLLGVVAMRLEPGLGVVAGEPAKERE